MLLKFSAARAVFASALATLPRAYAHFRHKPEWSRGLSLYSVVPHRSINTWGNSPICYPVDTIRPSVADSGTSTLNACNPLPYVPRNAPFQNPPDEKEKELVPATPSRSPSYLFHPLASMLRYRVHDNYSVGQVLLMLFYTTIIFCMSFYNSNPFTDLHRSAWVITSQIPFVYILATKNGVVGMMVGVGYEKLNFLHRLVGRLIVFGANVHFLGYVYKWSLNDTICGKLAERSTRWGIVALICVDLLGFCCTPYVAAAVLFYTFDHISRVFKTCTTTAKLRPLQELGITRVQVHSLNAGWRAGQHVRLRVLSSSMGWWR